MEFDQYDVRRMDNFYVKKASYSKEELIEFAEWLVENCLELQADKEQLEEERDEAVSNYENVETFECDYEESQREVRRLEEDKEELENKVEELEKKLSDMDDWEEKYNNLVEETEEQDNMTLKVTTLEKLVTDKENENLHLLEESIKYLDILQAMGYKYHKEVENKVYSLLEID